MKRKIQDWLHAMAVAAQVEMTLGSGCTREMELGSGCTNGDGSDSTHFLKIQLDYNS